MATHAACARKMKDDDARRRGHEMNASLAVRESLKMKPPKRRKKGK